MALMLYTLTGVLMDWKFYKIPNALSFFCALTGIFFSYIEHGMAEMPYVFTGMLIPIMSLYLLYYAGALGAGDIKLLAAVGTFVKTDIWKVIVFSFVFNGILAVYVMWKQGTFFTRLSYFRGYLRDCQLEKKILTDYEGTKQDQIHFSYGILGAVLIVMITC